MNKSISMTPCKLLECEHYNTLTETCALSVKYINKNSDKTDFICKWDSRAILLENKND
jgi:hypothetical protein